MKLALILALVSVPALAAPKSWIPIKDSRFDFTKCGSNGMINLNNPKEQQGCLGTVAGTKIEVLVIQQPRRTTVDVYHVVSEKLTRSIIDPDGGAHGEQTWEMEIKSYDVASNTDSGRATKLKMNVSWEYSEGTELLDGNSPDGYKIALSLADTTEEDPSRQ